MPIRSISHFSALLRRFQCKIAIIVLFFCSIFLKRADRPYIRLWKVFSRRLQGRTNWHKRTLRTDDSRFSSSLCTPLFCCQTCILLFGIRVPPYSERKICGFRCAVSSRLRCHLLGANSWGGG